MAKLLSSVCKLCRREGEKLYLKGERCFTPNAPLKSAILLPDSMDARGRSGGRGMGTAAPPTLPASCAPSRRPAVSMVCWNANSAAIMTPHYPPRFDGFEPASNP